MKRFASYGLLILVASMVLGGIPLSAEAASDSNVLLRLVIKAQNQIEQQIKNIENSEVEKLYAEGITEVKLLEEAIENEDVDSSREHFLSAMRIFKKITHMVSDQPRVQAEDKAEAKLEAVQAAPPRDYASDLKRLDKYVTSLKSVARTHGADLDFSKLDGLFASTQKQIEDRSYGEVEESLEKIKRIVLDINKTIREYANQKATDRAKNYAQQYMQKVDRLISQAKKANLSDEIILELEGAKKKLESASSTSEVIKEIRKIIYIEQKFDLTKANQLESRMMQLVKKLDRISDVDKIDESKIIDAREKLEKIKQLISEGELDEANKELRELNDFIRDFQNST